MTTVKVKFSPASNAADPGSIYFAITHERVTRRLATPCRLYAHEWDARRAMPAAPRAQSQRLSMMARRLQLARERLRRVIAALEARGTAYTADDIVTRYHELAERLSVTAAFDAACARLRRNAKLRTAETYASALNSLMRYTGGSDMLLDELSADIIEDYSAFLHRRGLVPNTISFYMRILRAVYNRAADNGDLPDTKPFRRVYTGVDNTAKRALPLAAVQQIKALALADSPALDYARDMFLLSFYLRGMSFIDMAYLHKSDLVKTGYVTYRRRKTGRLLKIAWTPQMQSVVDKYDITATPYLLPIIGNDGGDTRRACRNAACRINHNLKTIGHLIGLSVPLTLYVARHSWATAARSKGVPLSVISEGMGHRSEATTRIYLASLDTAAVDNANAMIIASI
ncbi:MAG: phage integrase SAM-like domain-containing protein [Muribaculaceae bacterium]